MMPREIFLIDDDIDDQELFCDALKEVDSTIVCYFANNGLEAIKILKQQLFVPDLIFVDLNMPISDGYEFLSLLSQAFLPKTTPVIVYSTASDEKARLKALQLGAHQYITKPSTFSGIVTLLRELLKNIAPVQHG